MYATKTRSKPARSLRFADSTVTITEGKSQEAYGIEAVKDGESLLGFRVTKKSSNETHDVDTVDGTCDCRGHYAYGYCRHLSAVRKLQELGMIAR
jgi:hypothetical protein